MKKLILAVGLLLAGTQAFAGFSTRGGRMAPMIVSIQFGSIGTGVDQKAVQNANSVVQQHQKMGVVVEVVRNPWGHEGEFTLCVRYNNLSVAYEAEQDFKAATAGARSPVKVERVFACEGMPMPNPPIR